MKKINLIQNTEEWHNWRKEGVGASDVACLLGLNPFKTRHDFLQQWMGITTHQNYSANHDIQRGHRLEAAAREALSKKLSLTFAPQCGEWEEDSFFRASLDGHNDERNIICEIKAPRSFKPMSDTNYFQMQAQLVVSGARECIFCQVVEREGAPHIRWEIVKPDPKAAVQIRDAVLQFKTEVQFERDFNANDETIWRDYLQTKSIFDEAEQQFRIAEARLKGSLGTQKEKTFFTDDGRAFMLSRHRRRGAVDYARIPELAGVSLESYRKDPIDVLTVKELEPGSN